MHTTVLSENAWKTSHTISSISGIVVWLWFPCMFGWCLTRVRWRLHFVLSRVLRPWTNFFASPLLQQSASCAALASQQCKRKESVSLQDKSWKSCCWPLCNYLSSVCRLCTWMSLLCEVPTCHVAWYPWACYHSLRYACDCRNPWTVKLCNGKRCTISLAILLCLLCFPGFF
jgi:hypothetical protein